MKSDQTTAANHRGTTSNAEVKRVLVVGCGYVGRVIAELFVERGATCFGLKRNPADLPAGVRPLAGDVTSSNLELPPELDLIVYGVSAGESSDERYRQIYVDGLRNIIRHATAKQRFFFISSTSVFGQCDGEWVDETTTPAPAHFTAQRILEAESVLLESGQPATVLRAGGFTDRVGRACCAQCTPVPRAAMRVTPTAFTATTWPERCYT